MCSTVIVRFGWACSGQILAKHHRRPAFVCCEGGQDNMVNQSASGVSTASGASTSSTALGLWSAAVSKGHNKLLLEARQIVTAANRCTLFQLLKSNTISGSARTGSSDARQHCAVQQCARPLLQPILGCSSSGALHQPQQEQKQQ